ncbi:KdsC family phosphatase [Planktosalinus lacus]|uniref:3-deoxy-D-manno-octulosonate 8-phosphate phosphatase n=1 Tax=Planktosalinus lacus TaxID=1526573 RepID=A0A8J2Y6U8_9FLAO|nr:HAD-IIIA family hydrolase [Planktosalinus lacus]GGD83958.1 3-deoxy-D-manno-octulosonate 8-phosphate phosphatase [Planktosalinus lacus]
MEEKSYKEYLQHINSFVFDVDGVLTDGTITITTEGDLLRNMSIKDGYAIKTAIEQGYHVCIISGGSNEGVKKRLRALGVTNIHLGVQHKTEVLDEYFDIYNIKPENTLYMGDDIPDLYAMKLVGLPTCPQDAATEIKAISKYISHRKGGKGCVRDVIEQVLKVQGKWLLNQNAKTD